MPFESNKMEKMLVVDNISKAYCSYGSEWKRIIRWFGIDFKPVEENWVLKNISFSMMKGETIGIIGENGAGKSTLLKIITGTLKQTSGNVMVNGKITAILELGMGFHPDLTGRQNAYHSAGLMGYSFEEINKVIKDIEEFAELGEYFDEPVRTYSSGMQMRLAFSVATAFRPDILIIDEALSVGDAYFQHKSFDRIRQFQQQGTNLLFVSHDKSAVLAVCDKAILLEKGVIIKEGGPEEVCDYYNALIADKENSTVRQEKTKNGKVSTISGTGDAKLLEIGLFNIKNERVEFVGVGEKLFLKIKLKTVINLDELTVGFMIRDRLGQHIFGTNSYNLKKINCCIEKNSVMTYIFSFEANLGVGSYSITLAFHSGETHLTKNYLWEDNALVFKVVNLDKFNFAGLSWIDTEVSVENE